MAQPTKIVLSASRDIPFNKLQLSQSNVRHIKAGVSIEELAEDIARRTLLQSITVRPVIAADGAETGFYEIPAGGRRFRALELLVKQKRLARTVLIPCVVRTDGIAEEDSLAENIQRAPLHALDQFRAFLALRQKGQSEEEIAAAFFVTASVVKQRLRLASVSPRLLDVYAEDGLTLDQLMAFTVNGDHQRQEQVFERITQSYAREPYVIRRMLTEGAVRASDKRARFIGLDAYVAAGGGILRDLFQGDDGGWLQDVGLLDRLVTERLREAADAVRAEGWHWIEVAPDFAYGHSFGLRQLRGEVIPLTDDEQAAADALRTEYEALGEACASADVDETIDQRIAAIEAALAAFDNRPLRFDPADVARAGAFVSIDGSGALRVERGFIRPEDEPPVEQTPTVAMEADGTDPHPGCNDAQTAAEAEPLVAAEPDEDEGLKPLSDRLMTELTAHRTLALRHALGEMPDVAFLAALHALCLKLFYRYAVDTCLDLDIRNVVFEAQAPGLNDTDLARAVTARHQAWTAALPKQPTDLWDALTVFDTDSRQALFAHCVGLSVNAVHEAWNRRPKALAHADRLAVAVDLDMVAAGWTPTIETYLGRVTKARILDAVREVRGARATDRIAHLKKGEMAEAAQALLAGSGWLPEPLRTPGRALPTVAAADPADAPAPSHDAVVADAMQPDHHAIAAE